MKHTRQPKVRSVPRRIRVLAGLCLGGASACAPTPAAAPDAAPPADAPSSQVFVAFDTTATCKATIAQGSGWAEFDLNSLVATPLMLGAQQGNATAVTHAALGSNWADLTGATACLLQDWAPDTIPFDPTKLVYLRLGEPGCERLDPVLGSTHDIHDSGYTITAVLPALISIDGAAPATADIVRLSSSDATRRLTLVREDLERCVSAEPREARPAELRPRPTALPQAGHHGPSPIVIGTNRIAGAAPSQRWSLEFAGIDRAMRKWVRGGIGRTWRPEGRPIELAADGTVVRIQARWTDGIATADEARPTTPTEPTTFANPQHQVLAATEASRSVAAAWATLEGRYPTAGNAEYLEATNARSRRAKSELDASPATAPAAEVQALPAFPRRTRELDTVVLVEPAAEGTAAFQLVARASVDALAPRRANAKKSGGFAKSTASQLRRWLDVAAALRPLAADVGAASLFVEGEATGLSVTAMDAAAQQPVALVSGMVEGRAQRLHQPAVDVPLASLSKSHCHVIAAESLAPGDAGTIDLSIGILRGETFTPIAVDHRGSPRAGVAACWLPDDPGLVARIETDAPFTLGLFAAGNDIGLGHVLGAMNSKLRRAKDDDMLTLDGSVGLPDPADVEESIANAQRQLATFNEESR